MEKEEKKRMTKERSLGRGLDRLWKISPAVPTIRQEKPDKTPNKIKMAKLNSILILMVCSPLRLI